MPIPAGARVTVLFFFREVSYTDGFDMDVECFYSFDADNGEMGGFVEGEIEGAQAFQRADTVVQTEFDSVDGDENDDGGEMGFFAIVASMLTRGLL